MPRPPRSFARRGSTMIEFLFIVITLLIVMFGGIEADRMMMVYTNLNDAAKAGARYAIVHGSTRTSGSVSAGDYSAVTSLVKSHVTGVNLDNVGVEVRYADGNNNIGSRVQVIVRYQYDPWVGFLSNLWNFEMDAQSKGIITW